MLTHSRRCMNLWFCQHDGMKFQVYAKRLLINGSCHLVNVPRIYLHRPVMRSTPKLQIHRLFRKYHISCVHRYTSVAVHENDKIADSIQRAQSTDELFNVLARFNANHLTPVQSWNFSCRLLSLHYQTLYQEYSWLQDNVHIAHIQLQLSNSNTLQTLCEPVLNHPEFQKWTDVVGQNVGYYSGDQLCDSMISLLYLGVPLEDNVVHKMLFRMQDCMVEFSPQALEMASVVMKAFPGFNYSLIRLMAKRIDMLCQDLESPTSKEFKSLANVIANAYKFMNVNDLQKVVIWLTRMVVNNPQLLQTPESLSAVVRLGRKLAFLYDVSIDRSAVRKLISSSTTICSSLVHSLNAAQIAQISNGLKQNGCYNAEISIKMRQRAFSLLTPESRLYEILQLMYSLCRITPRTEVLHFTGALQTKLTSCEDVDIITLSTVADLLIYLPYVSVDLISLFHRRVIDRLDELLSYSGRFNRIVALLIRYPFRNEKLRSQFIDGLLRQLKSQEGINMRKVSLIASYLLPAGMGSIPSNVFDRLLADIQRWQLPDVYRLANGISFARDPRTTIMNRQLQQLHAAVYSCIIMQIDSIHSLELLYQLVLKFVARNRRRDPVLTDRLMSLFGRFSQNLNDDVSAVKIARSFEQICYSSPDVFDDVTQYVVDSELAEGGRKVVAIVAACARVGYQPKNVEKLLLKAQIVYQRWIDQRNYRMALPLLERLTSLQLYLENDLSRLFTLESIEDIDRYVAEIPDYASLIENCMMRLNRAVVLECPQLDIPWFHEQFCSEHFIEDDRVYDDEGTMNSQVSDVLCEVLGGDRFVQRNVFSPYYYKIDFECVLNKKGRPVDLKKVARLGARSADDPGWQRLAIFALKEPSYCCNSKQTNGYRQTVKRHLEIMNYKVIEIPHFEWFSMGLTECVAKYDYIRRKLFK